MNKIKTILVSQPKPNSEKSPYIRLKEKHNLKIIESLMMDFSLKATYPWHEEKNKILKVMLLYSKVV